MNVSIDQILDGEIGLDICGRVTPELETNPKNCREKLPVSDLREFLLDQYHRDEMPSVEGALFHVAKPLIPMVKARYREIRLDPKIKPINKFDRTYHRTYRGRGRKKAKTESYGYPIDGGVTIPESAEQWGKFEQYGDLEIGIVYRTSNEHMEKGVNAPRFEDIPEGWYYADNRATKLSERIVPKCVPSIRDGVVLKKDGNLVSLRPRRR